MFLLLSLIAVLAIGGWMAEKSGEFRTLSHSAVEFVINSVKSFFTAVSEKVDKIT